MHTMITSDTNVYCWLCVAAPTGRQVNSCDAADKDNYSHLIVRRAQKTLWEPYDIGTSVVETQYDYSRSWFCKSFLLMTIFHTGSRQKERKINYTRLLFL